MNERSLRILEFDKVKDNLKRYVNTKAAKEIIDDLKPYDNIYDVKQHLEETKEALDLQNIKGVPPFEGIYDIRSGIEMAKKGSMLMPVQILRIGAVLRCSRRFKKYLCHKEDEQGFRIIEDICSGITELKKLEDKIFLSIEDEERVSDKASVSLYSIRRSLRDKNASVRDRVNSLMRNYAQYLQDSIYTMRGDRYVLPVKAENKSMVPGLVHDQSSSGATLYIEPMGLVNLNNEIKELKLKEKAEIEKVLEELSGEIYNDASAVETNANILWELDFIFAKAKFADDLNCIIPAVNEKGEIDIVQGRHPLIDRDKVVPMDIYMGKNFNCLVVTGPNTGGKTVVLKNVGLLHIMALSGLMIPARENSTVGFFKEIFADIGDEQSIEQSLSTFSSHMSNIVNIIDEAHSDSLVLFDELGAGTDPTEGAALAVAILENLKNKGVNIVATTHYSELKAYALKTNGVENASVEFDVETLKPTYRLIIGIPGKSNAFEISKRLGLPNFIIEEARKNIASDALEFEDLVQHLQNRNLKAERYRREAEEIKAEALKLKQNYSEKIHKFEDTRDKIYMESRREAKNIIKAAKEEADNIIREMHELEKEGYGSQTGKELEIRRKKLGEKLNDVEDKLYVKKTAAGEELKDVKEGEEVFLPSLNQNVIVLTTPDNRHEVQVQAGIMKISVKLKDLRKSRNSNKNNSKNSRREARLNLKSVPSSVDVRGMDSIEARYVVDKYLDDAYMGGLREITIIHGKGTGVLRKSINDMLKRHSHVKDYRLGEYGEGGTGVTIVELK